MPSPLAANLACPVLFLGVALPGLVALCQRVASACVIPASLAYVRYPESFCPLNKSKWIGSSYTVFARTESC